MALLTRRASARWSTVLILITGLLAAVPGVRADDHGVVFLFPTKGLNFNYKDTINVTYTSDFPTPNLYTFCDSQQKKFTAAAPYNGSVLVELDFTSSATCWFNLRPGTVAGFGANSNPFTILSAEHGASTVGLLQPTTMTSSSTSSATSSSTTSTATPESENSQTTGTATTAGATSSPSETGTAAPSAGLSVAASAGIGVGVAAVVLIAAGIAAYCLWRKRKQAKGAMTAEEGKVYHRDGEDGAAAGVTRPETRQWESGGGWKGDNNSDGGGHPILFPEKTSSPMMGTSSQGSPSLASQDPYHQQSPGIMHDQAAKWAAAGTVYHEMSAVNAPVEIGTSNLPQRQ